MKFLKTAGILCGIAGVAGIVASIVTRREMKKVLEMDVELYIEDEVNEREGEVESVEKIQEVDIPVAEQA